MKKLYPLTACITILLCLSGSLYADFINGELTLSEPENGEFFEPGDTVIATLALTDQNDNELRVVEGDDTTLRGVLCWVSGPRQHFMTTEPYERFRIRTHNEGFYDESGFDLETQQMPIILPDEVPDEGTYTVLFECNRYYNGRWYSLYLMGDIQVEDAKPTETKSYRYLTCNVQGCHQNISQHSTTDLTTCVICHTHDYNTPWHRIEHNRNAHRNHGVETCHECHRANADINNFSAIACYTCHHPHTPDDHREYDDDDCAPCHQEGEESDVYRVHDERAPTQPDDFDLIFPEDDAVVENDTILFFWDESHDDDEDDILTYEFQIADNSQMRNRREISTADSTSYWIEGGLENRTDYWWRVLVYDLNTGYITSESSFKFTTDFPEPNELPSPFGLIAPTIDDTVYISNRGFFATDFSWQMSIDPNFGDTVTYELTLNDSGRFGDEPLEVTIEDIQDTTFNVNIPEALGIHDSLINWVEPWVVYWNVIAISNDDTVLCDSSFAVYLGSAEFRPPNPFGLIEPAMDDAILMNEDGLYITDFSWHLSADPNVEDSVTYVFILSDNGRFGEERIAIFEDLQDTLLTDINLMVVLEIPDSLIQWHEPWAVTWAAIAISNDDSVWCDSAFALYMGSTPPYLPSAFGLIAPVDGDTIGLDGPFETNLVWQTSVDPNGDEVLYNLTMELSYPNEDDLIYEYVGLPDTVFHFSLTDSIDAEHWEDYWRVEWQVSAIANGDSVRCDSTFGFRFSSNSDSLYGHDLFASLTLSEPVGGFFMPGDSVIATLLLTDAEGDTLRIDDVRNTQLITVELWVSGPRQEYKLVQPYEMYSIVDQRGFHDDRGFNPETGQIAIAIPDSLEKMGSYTVLFKCMRRFNGALHSQFPAVDFLIGQLTPTFAESERYITCNGEGCHDDGFRDHGTHASVNLSECNVCHTRDHDLPWDGMIHSLRCHEEDGTEYFDMATTCHLCHLANAGIDHYSNRACFSCHLIEDAPLHETYSDEECAECHDIEHTVYENHDEFEPTVPDSFDLLSPRNFTVIDEWPITLSWDRTDDHDPGDYLIYEVQLCTDENFEQMVTYEVGDTNRFDLENLMPDDVYWWRIRAIDLNSEGTISTQTWRFRNLVNDASEQQNNVPLDFSVSSAFPNPFNSNTSVVFGLPRSSDITVTVHDMAGRQVARLAHGIFRSGHHKFNWNASRMPSGIYIIKCEADGKSIAMRKVLLIR